MAAVGHKQVAGPQVPQRLEIVGELLAFLHRRARFGEFLFLALARFERRQLGEIGEQQVLIDRGFRDPAPRIGKRRLPGAIALKLVAPWLPNPSNAVMMPATVPSNPINGETEAVVANQLILRSSLASSSLTPSCKLRSKATRLMRVRCWRTWRSTSL